MESKPRKSVKSVKFNESVPLTKKGPYESCSTVYKKNRAAITEERLRLATELVAKLYAELSGDPVSQSLKDKLVITGKRNSATQILVTPDIFACRQKHEDGLVGYYESILNPLVQQFDIDVENEDDCFAPFEVGSTVLITLTYR